MTGHKHSLRASIKAEISGHIEAISRLVPGASITVVLRVGPPATQDIVIGDDLDNLDRVVRAIRDAQSMHGKPTERADWDESERGIQWEGIEKT